MSCCPTYQFWDEWLTCGVIDGRVIYYLTDGFSDDFSISTVDAISNWSNVNILNYITEPLKTLSKINLNVSYLIDIDNHLQHLNFNDDEELKQLATILRRLILDNRLDPVAINAFHNSQIISMHLLANLGVT